MGTVSPFNFSVTDAHNVLEPTSLELRSGVPFHFFSRRYRAKIYIECTMPQHQQTWKHLLAELKWKRYKKHLVQHSAHLKTIVNSTRLIDVPIYCRLIDDF